MSDHSLLKGGVTGALLERHGHQVQLARTCTEAVVAATADGFDLVLLDMGVDGDAEGGLAIAGAIRRLRECIGLMPIIALTANGMHESHARFLAAGLDGIMVKPLAIDLGLAAALQAAGLQERHAG